MRLDVPVMFNAEVVHKGKRKAVQEPQVEWVEVEVREASDIEAPMATEWTRDDGTRMATRWFEGSHWIPFEHYDEDDKRFRIDVEGLRERLARGNRFQNPLSVGVEHVLTDFAAGRRPRFDPADFRSVESSDRAEVHARAYHNASNTLVVDGQVWVRGSEPVYVLSRSRIERGTGRHTMRPEVTLISSARDPKDIFRADRFDDMVGEAANRYSQAVEIDDTARITVYIPSSLRYDDERAALFTSFDGVLESQRRFLPTAPLPDVRTWLELAEALAAARADWNEDTAAALETAADTYVAVTLTGDSYYGSEIQKALSRWRMRPIGDDFDGSAVLKPF